MLSCLQALISPCCSKGHTHSLLRKVHISTLSKVVIAVLCGITLFKKHDADKEVWSSGVSAKSAQREHPPPLEAFQNAAGSMQTLTLVGVKRNF